MDVRSEQRALKTYRDGQDGRHAIEVVGVRAHREDLRNDGSARPLYAEDLRQLLEVDRRALSDAEDVVTEPAHAEVAELVVEELNAELGGEQRNVLDDGLSDSPLLVLSEIDDGRKQGLREEVDADDVVDEFELADQLKTDVALLVFQQLEEEGQEVFDGGLLSEKGSEAADLRAEGGLDVRRSVTGEVSHAGQESSENDLSVEKGGET